MGNRTSTSEDVSNPENNTTSETQTAQNFRISPAMVILIVIIIGLALTVFQLVSENNRPGSEVGVFTGSDVSAVTQVGQHRFIRDRIETFDSKQPDQLIETQISRMKGSSIVPDDRAIEIADFILESGPDINLRNLLEPLATGQIGNNRLLQTDGNGNISAARPDNYIHGTVNEVLVTATDNGARVYLRLPQPIHTTAAVQFASLELTSTAALNLSGVTPTDDQWGYVASLNQDLHTGANVTFNNITVTGTVDGVDLSTTVDQAVLVTSSPSFQGLNLSGLTASRLVALNGTQGMTSVADLTAWISGTTNRITVSNDGDGTLTLSTPQDLHTAANVTFNLVNGVNISTLNSTVGTHSSWLNQSLTTGAYPTFASVYWGSNGTRTETRDNAGLRGDAGARSGFFDTPSPVNFPSGASNWWHLIDCRHNNVSNNFALQLASSFFTRGLYYRNVGDWAGAPWSKVALEGSNTPFTFGGNDVGGAQSRASCLTVSTNNGNTFVADQDIGDNNRALTIANENNNNETYTSLTLRAGGNVNTRQVDLKFKTNGNIPNYGYLYFTYDGSDNFRFDKGGFGTSDSGWAAAGADYAEFFENVDGEAMDPGYTVVLVGDKVRRFDAALDSIESIIGVTRTKKAGTGGSVVIGNGADLRWSQTYLTDEWGHYIMEDYYEWSDEKTQESYMWCPGESLPAGHTEETIKATATLKSRQQKNPTYDPNQRYISRRDRPEWILIGLLGQIRVRSDQIIPPRWIKMKEITTTIWLWLVR